MSNLKTIDRQPFEDLLGMSGGHVLDFTDATFASFFAESVRCNIHDERYTTYGTSKAKKLRAFWDVESDHAVAKVLSELVDLWEYKNPQPDPKDTARATRCREIIRRLKGQQPVTEVTEKDFLQLDWSLAQMIDVACELGFLTVDIKKFSHALRDFRNYIHPYQQMSSRFAPDKHTAEICSQVLRAAIASLSGRRKS